MDVLAEGVGFEPTEAQKTSTVFETVPFVRSGSLPSIRLARNFDAGAAVFWALITASGAMTVIEALETGLFGSSQDARRIVR